MVEISNFKLGLSLINNGVFNAHQCCKLAIKVKYFLSSVKTSKQNRREEVAYYSEFDLHNLAGE